LKRVHIIGKEEKTDGVLIVNRADTPATKRATEMMKKKQGFIVKTKSTRGQQWDGGLTGARLSRDG